jgi:hypothetical protein
MGRNFNQCKSKRIRILLVRLKLGNGSLLTYGVSRCSLLFSHGDIIMAGYHSRDIAKGEFGEVSKIEEELEELKDAIETDNPVMALMELADLYGAIRGYLHRHHRGRTMKDLQRMADVTQLVFDNGLRK